MGTATYGGGPSGLGDQHLSICGCDFWCFGDFFSVSVLELSKLDSTGRTLVDPRPLLSDGERGGGGGSLATFFLSRQCFGNLLVTDRI